MILPRLAGLLSVFFPIPQAVRTWVAAVILALAATGAAAAPVSEIVIDADTGRAAYAAGADLRRAPASLAKMMTLLLAFEALDAGRLRPADRLVVSARAARQQPSRLGLAPGARIPVDAALRAIAVVSANDVAVALAERIGGSEAGFVQAMNRRAALLGMRNTRFGNATGLSPAGGLTTARDMALLARYLIRRHRARYALFATRTIRWRGQGRPNHNRLLGRVRGVDGIKTGYTVAAGFNLAASGVRHGRRVIVVVLGAHTAAARDLLVSNLLESGFSEPRAKPAPVLHRAPMAERRHASPPPAPVTSPRTHAKPAAHPPRHAARKPQLPQHSPREPRHPPGKPQLPQHSHR